MSQRTISQTFACCTLLLVIATIAYSQNLPAPAQNPQNPPARTSPSTTSPNRTNPSSNVPSDSTSFLNKAIEISQAEIELGRLASSKASDMRIKNFGTMMVTDHSAGLKKLQSLPGGKNNTVKLTTEHEILKTRLSGLSGKQFDREYISAMVSGHRHAVGLFEKHTNPLTAPSNKPSPSKGGADRANVPGVSASPGSSNTDLKKVASELLLTIKKHLMEAERIENSLSAPAK
jgi:putative membrane protein